MTQLEVTYRYGTPPGEATMRALDNAREVYGIRRITFHSNEKSFVWSSTLPALKNR